MMDIKLTADELKRLAQILDEGGPNTGSKINAIKFVRLARLHQKSTNPSAVAASTAVPSTYSTIGLAEAKDAVEEWMADRGMTDGEGNPLPRLAAPRGRIVPFQPIRRVVCNFGEGDVELDMEGMSLRVLSGLNGSIRIEDALSLIDLYKRVKDWEDELSGPCKPAGDVV